eukprot:m.356594 g.356594  ORF g.356594 m.356594 type:complete len:919 (+) comp17587_c0_seq1:304-3060(+)
MSLVQFLIQRTKPLSSTYTWRPLLYRTSIPTASFSTVRSASTQLFQCSPYTSPQRRLAATSAAATPPSEEMNISGMAHLQIICSTPDTAPAAFLFTGQRRYLFNCGEGTQRFCSEHKIRLANVTDVFLTQSTWECMGGLPGMLITLTDSTEAQPQLHGPPELANLMAGMRTFMPPNRFSHNGVQYYREDEFSFNDGLLEMRGYVIRNERGQRAKELGIVEMPDDEPSQLSDARQILAEKAQKVKQMAAERHDQQQKKPKQAKLEQVEGGVETSKPKSTASGSAAQSVTDLEDSTPGRRMLEKLTRSASPSPPGSPSGRISPPRPQFTLPSEKKVEIEQELALGTTTCFVGKLIPDRYGKFDPKKAKALGIPPQGYWGKLSKGIAVEYNGRVIQPEEVVQPLEPLPHFAIVHVPEESFIEPLLARKELFDHFQGLGGANSCVVHFTSESVYNSPRYKDVLDQFGDGVIHSLVDSNKGTSSSFLASDTMTDLLTTLDAEAFQRARVVPSVEQQTTTLPVVSYPNSKVMVGEPLARFHLIHRRDSQFLDTTTSFSNNIRETLVPSTALQAKTQQVRTKLQAMESMLPPGQTTMPASRQAALSQRYLHFLGTASALPCSLRNVTGACLTQGIAVDATGTPLVHPDATSILLDCGEGTYGQLQRKFGSAIDDVMCSLRMIYVSHMHADHHLGLTQILSCRNEAWSRRHPDKPLPHLVVVAPRDLWYLSRFTRFLTRDDSTMIDSRYLRRGTKFPPTLNKSVIDAFDSAMDALDLKNMMCPRVDHCPGATGLVLEWRDGFRFALSGDTRPCAEFALAGKNANVVVHEATFEDALKEHAVVKKHSTTGEAVQLALRMNAGVVVLTHFSQRYPCIPVVDEAFNQQTTFAFDLMSIPLHRAQRLPHLTPALEELIEVVRQKSGSTDE